MHFVFSWILCTTSPALAVVVTLPVISNVPLPVSPGYRVWNGCTASVSTCRHSYTSYVYRYNYFKHCAA